MCVFVIDCWKRSINHILISLFVVQQNLFSGQIDVVHMGKACVLMCVERRRTFTTIPPKYFIILDIFLISRVPFVFPWGLNWIQWLRVCTRECVLHQSSIKHASVTEAAKLVSLSHKYSPPCSRSPSIPSINQSLLPLLCRYHIHGNLLRELHLGPDTESITHSNQILADYKTLSAYRRQCVLMDHSLLFYLQPNKQIYNIADLISW